MTRRWGWAGGVDRGRKMARYGFEIDGPEGCTWGGPSADPAGLWRHLAELAADVQFAKKVQGLADPGEVEHDGTIYAVTRID